MLCVVFALTKFKELIIEEINEEDIITSVTVTKSNLISIQIFR